MERKSVERKSKLDDVEDRIKWLEELKDAIPKASDQATPRTLRIWGERLVRIPMPLLFVAANLLAERHTFFPSLAEILQVCKEISGKSDDREWKRRVEGWKAEALSQGEAAKMLTALTNAAKAGRRTAAIVPIREALKERPAYEVGADASDEEWERRKAATKEKA